MSDQPGGLPIESRTTIERIVRTSLLTSLLLGYAAWCFRDGYLAYPEQNVKAALDKLGIAADPLPTIHPQLKTGTANDIKQGTSVQELRERFGEPLSPEPNKLLYFGPAGYLQITVRNDLVREAKWEAETLHEELDLQIQKGMGAVIGGVGLLILLQLVRVLATKARLDDDGLKVRGKPFVPYEAMTGLNTDRYRQKGWVDLEYENDGQLKLVRLNDYHIREFRPILQAICARKDFPIGWLEEVADPPTQKGAK